MGSEYLFLAAIFTTAFLYASIGHGGASGYLALMSLWGMAPLYMKTSALTMNVFVAGSSFALYAQAGNMNWRLFFPLIATSLPMAFFGAWQSVSPDLYKRLLGCCLLLAFVRLLFSPLSQGQFRQPSLGALLFIGGLLGYIAGLIGIGGGIILSPLLLLFRWASLKEAAAISALFILVNSASGLLGHWLSGSSYSPHILLWVVVAFVGGVLGAYMANHRFETVWLRYILSAVLFMAGIKLLWL